ncbi:MAG: cytochrome b N-terminal domain-containing protein [Bdellovibrionaceae bacterium]|nr:cytochrome b N-terminal domain-containing protein [Pseudobdellovibrionaceae bacterium]
MVALIRHLDRFFNRLFSSRYNPIHASGTVALGLFFIVLITGLYLSFFYRLGEPYESVAALNADLFFGSWIRAVHRYASDLMAISVVFHILRMVAQGKTWGPRTLAWVTGVGLVGLMLISAWTGYVMVWDVQGQALAIAGARIMDSLGLFPDPIMRSFSGAENAAASFFFLNLFLHVAIPLGMVFGVWAHTSRIARADWLPSRAFMGGLSALLILVSVVWPAPLGQKADLLLRVSEYPKDWIFNFWMPWTESSPLAVFAFFILGGLVLAAAPWYLKPREKRKPSFNDPNICMGCSQCVQDCPYEAIQMVSMDVRSKMKEVALVNPDLCVSCGLCAASCEPMTIGPEGRKGGHQVRAAKAFMASLNGNLAGQTLIVGCRNQSGVLKYLNNSCRTTAGYQLYPVDCPGTLHSVVYGLLAQKFSRVVIASCPERICVNKDGSMLLNERLSGKREPTLPESSLQKKIHVFPVGEGEESAFFRNISSGRELPVARKGLRSIPASAIVAGLGIVLIAAVLTRSPSPAISDKGLLRLNIRLVGQTEKTCRPPSAEETAKLPLHMRAAEICSYRSLSYRMKLNIDGKEILDEPVHPGGLKRDRPLYVSRDIEVDSGTHRIEFSMEPLEASAQTLSLALQKNVEFRPGQIALIRYSPDEKNAVLKEKAP